jgi:Ku protein
VRGRIALFLLFAYQLPDGLAVTRSPLWTSSKATRASASRSSRRSSKRWRSRASTIEIDQFLPKQEIDELYLHDPYYLVPDGEVAQQAFAVIREAIKQEGMVALGKVVFTSREHIIALELRGKGLLGMTLRYPYEIRKEEDYFDDIPDEKIIPKARVMRRRC